MGNQTTVAETTTNTIAGSQTFADVDLRPICENMTNSEFRAVFATAQVTAVEKLGARITALQRWSQAERNRVSKWFGRNDETTRMRLLTGLTKVLAVVRGFNEHNVVRSGSAGDLATGCTPHPRGTANEAAHVCAPDTATHTIAISARFCTMRPWTDGADSHVSTIIHEATHFHDTMSSTDDKYTITPLLALWGWSNPDLAINNADSIAGYVVDGDD
ncbi:M35 family metallo-endopeptidase [Burkholderia sp. BCC0322]|uniref:M35 family metallo-endopeptidase n=1 Tax=unclassified Burkholderia TaxID=2613784 RepID=UPI0015884BD5|nr:M35 family metallo-endopeptidase [Burkholderia sp. BCC0322]